MVEKLTEVGMSPNQVNGEGSREIRTQCQIPSHPKTQKNPLPTGTRASFPSTDVIPIPCWPVLPRGRNPGVPGMAQGPRPLLGASGTDNPGPEAEAMLSIPPEHGYPARPA